MASKTASVILYDGDLNGVIRVKLDKVELYAAPIERIDKLISKAGEKTGVYLLISNQKVYVGQSLDLAKRIKQHTAGKDWWIKAIVISTTDNNLGHTEIDYLENEFITRAQNNNSWVCDNKTSGNTIKVTEEQEIILKEIINYSVISLELLGIDVLTINNKQKPTTDSKTDNNDLRNIVLNAKQNHTLAKKPILDYLSKKGYTFNKQTSFSSLQEKKNTFWMNPNVDLLNSDWNIVLNNQITEKLYILKVPANELKCRIKNGIGDGFNTRILNGKKLIDISINADTFIESSSKYNFNNYIVEEIKY